MVLTKNEIIVLKHLEDGKQHSDTPENITDDQFASAALSLKSKGLIKAFVNYGKVESSQIEFQGVAALDDLNDMEKRILLNLLREKYNLTEEQYVLLVYARENGHTNNIFDCNRSAFVAIWEPLKKDNLLKIEKDEKHPNGFLCLSGKGEKFLDEIANEVAYQLSEPTSHSNSDSADDVTTLKQKLGRAENELADLRRHNKELHDQITEFESDKTHSLEYHYEVSAGRYDKLKLSIRERIVIMLAIYRRALADVNAEMSLGMKSLVGNKKTVTDYLSEMKLERKRPLEVSEKDNIRFVLEKEHIDIGYVSDYIN